MMQERFDAGPALSFCFGTRAMGVDVCYFFFGTFPAFNCASGIADLLEPSGEGAGHVIGVNWHHS